MKKSELRQLIREEIQNIRTWDELSQKFNLNTEDENYLMNAVEDSDTTYDIINKIVDKFEGDVLKGLIKYYTSNPKIEDQ